MAASLTHLAKDGATEISGKQWPDVFAGVAQAAEKFGIRNTGDRALANLQLQITAVPGNDGWTMVRIGADPATLSRPYGVAAALSGPGAGGVWSVTGLVYYVLTAYNATGETIGSAEVSVHVDVTTKKVTVSWTPVSGASGYKLYRTTAPGSYGASSLRATVAGQQSNQYVDDGGGLSAGSPPAANTTGGAAPDYGTPPALGSGPITIGTLAVGQEWFYWVNRVVPGGTSDAGNPRQSLREFTES
jgi:hypothetical protein